jgi:predicted transcriptional regulator
MDKELILKNGDENTYKITDKGRIFLKQLDQMEKML